MGKLVIVTEEAIAKGIRRVVAVTGNEASKSIHKSDIYQREFKMIEGKVNEYFNNSTKYTQKQLVKMITELSEEVSQSNTPYWKRENIRNDLKSLKKRIDDQEKARKAQIASRVFSNF